MRSGLLFTGTSGNGVTDGCKRGSRGDIGGQESFVRCGMHTSRVLSHRSSCSMICCRNRSSSASK